MVAHASGDKTYQARHTTISEHGQHIIRHKIRFTDKSYATFKCIRSLSSCASLSASLAAISGSSPATADAKHSPQLAQLLPPQPPAGSISLAADVPCSALWASISARVHSVGPEDDDGAVFSLTTAISITSGSGTGADCAAVLCCGASVEAAFMAGASVPDCCTPAGACGASAAALAAIVAAAGAS